MVAPVSSEFVEETGETRHQWECDSAEFSTPSHIPLTRASSSTRPSAAAASFCKSAKKMMARTTDDDDDNELRFICPITAYPYEGDLSHLCERVRLRSQGWTFATLRRKFNGKPMTYAVNHKNCASYVSCNPPKRSAFVKTAGILVHLWRDPYAMHEIGRRQAEREIANFVARQGGRITIISSAR